MRHKRRVFTLTDQQYERLREDARRLDLSISERLRRLIDEAIPPPPRTAARAHELYEELLHKSGSKTPVGVE